MSDWKDDLPRELTTDQLARLGPEARQILRWLSDMRDAGFDLPDGAMKQVVIGILDSVLIGIMHGEYRPDWAPPLKKETPDA